MGYHFFMYHSWYTSNFESPNTFFDVILVSSYHGCKGENVKLIPYYMIDIIYKTVKSSHLKINIKI